ncbi:hypothetical protein ACFWPU_00830 [Streptomyces sp. NPDC058471]|uniref:hypothetical protein n=1 Tax=Streptomyces sp. NPDC058471 TaxID=3346516 RepID=UPI0036505076
MTDIDKAAVYRHAATVIVRDGKREGQFFGPNGREGGGTARPEAVGDTTLSVCAIGACVRAQYELYGTTYASETDVFQDGYDNYAFDVKMPDGARCPSPDCDCGTNDNRNKSAEDIALLLKHQAEEVDQP